MAEKQLPASSTRNQTQGYQQPQQPRQSLEFQSALVSDGFSMPDLEAERDAPPAYGELHDQLQFSQPGFETSANVTEDGRVNININQKHNRLAELLGPSIRRQMTGEGGQEAAPLPLAYIPPSLGGQPGQTPPPRLNVVIQIVGSRGDVQPFVALGKVLKETYGHRVRLATHATFQSFVEENGLEFFNIGGDPAELMAFMVKHPGLMPGFDALKSGEVSKRRKGIQEILLGCWRSCVEPGDGMGAPMRPHGREEGMTFGESASLPGDPASRPFVADAIIANPPSFAHVHIAEKLGIPLHMMFTMPWSPTKGFPHPLANIQETNTDAVVTSYLSYGLVEMLTWQGLGDVINRFRERVLDLEPLSLIWAPGLLTRLRVPYTYCWSPALIPKPNDWYNHIDVAGFFFLNLASSYTPDPELAAFLNAGPPPIYVGFGSIVVDDPNAMTRLIFDAIHLAGVRALVSKGWGGLGAEDVGIPEGVYMIGNCPHDWLFQRVSCVIHHGGAGTTAAGINAGKPTVVVPFFGDQPFWGAMVARAGAGPDPIPYQKLNAENLAQAIKHALKPETLAKARLLGAKIREEKGCDVGGQSFHNHLDMESLRCSLAPSRAAVWRVRRTKVKLSPFAATVLAQEGLIQFSDLKLWRPKEYMTEGEPWDPISAAAASLVGDISSIAMAVTDFPRDIFQAARKDSSSQAGSSSQSPKPYNPNSNSVILATGASTSTNTLPSDATSTRVGELQGASTSELSFATPSVTVTSDPSSALSSIQEPSEAPASPYGQRSPNAPSSCPRREPSPSPSPALAPAPGFSMEAALGAGNSVQKIVSTGVKSPMNFCLGLAKGFRNTPKLYNDDTVRPQEKVTGLASGLKVAGKEFGLGFADGIGGLVTQPMKGLEKEGGIGFIKGVGKGIGGLIIKPAAGIWSIPAYTMQGAYLEVRNRFNKSMENYIFTSRILQGEEDLRGASPEVKRDIIMRWNNIKFDLKGFYQLKLKEAREEKQKAVSPAVEGPQYGEAMQPPWTGWLHTRHLSFEERKELHRRKETWKTGHVDAKVPLPPSETQVDDEFERAIQASVKETSRGNQEEDALIEQAIRSSVMEMQRRGQDLPEPVHQQVDGVKDADLAITDEEYQQLIEKALQQSMVLHAAGLTGGVQGDVHAPDSEDEELKMAIEISKSETFPPPPPREDEDDDEDIKKALEESKARPPLPPRVSEEDEEEELKRAIEESEAAAREEEAKKREARDEEEIVLEYVKRQSLAEEEYRRQQMKGKMRDAEEEDDELRKAMEESLRMNNSDGAGPSSSGM